MNKILERETNPTNTIISFYNYKPEIKQIESKKLIKEEYIKNKTYNEYYQEFLRLEKYRIRFWKLEGKIYIGIVVILAVLST